LNNTKRLFSANNNYSLKENLRLKYKTDFDNCVTSNSCKLLKIQKLHDKRIHLINKKTISHPKNKNYFNEKSNKFKIKKRKSNNIINIVNNVNGHPNDKNKNTELKVNINSYDIKCFIPDHRKNITNKINFNNNLSKSSQDTSNLDTNFNQNDKQNRKKRSGLSIEITNLAMTSKNILSSDKDIKKKIKNQNTHHSFMEKKLKMQILKKLKSFNDLFHSNKYNNRPNLEYDNDINEEDGKNLKIQNKRFLSKEINLNKYQNFDSEKNTEDNKSKDNLNNFGFNNNKNNISCIIDNKNNFSKNDNDWFRSSYSVMEKFDFNVLPNKDNLLKFSGNTLNNITKFSENIDFNINDLNCDENFSNKNHINKYRSTTNNFKNTDKDINFYEGEENENIFKKSNCEKIYKSSINDFNQIGEISYSYEKGVNSNNRNGDSGIFIFLDKYSITLEKFLTRNLSKIF